MDVHVRALYIDLICSYIEAMAPVHRVKPDTLVNISLLDDRSIMDVLDVFRHVHRTYFPVKARRAS